MKRKITLSIEEEILRRAREKARKRDIKLSSLVERFLDFFSDPWLYCFSCGERFRSGDAKVCARCSWLICPYCGSCRCSLSDEVAEKLYHMRRVYEDLLHGRVKD